MSVYGLFSSFIVKKITFFQINYFKRLCTSFFFSQFPALWRALLRVCAVALYDSRVLLLPVRKNNSTRCRQEAGLRWAKWNILLRRSCLLFWKKANSRRFWLRSFLFSFFSKIKERVRNIHIYNLVGKK